VNKRYDIVILGASYGSLLATRLLMAGHNVTLVCTAPTAQLIREHGTRVRFPVKGRDGLVEVDSRKLPGRLRAITPYEVEPWRFQLAVLGMQEAQYGAPDVRELMQRLGRARTPCLAIMNMPPLPYLQRIAQVKADQLDDCYTDPSVWQWFDPQLVTLASPDPQAFRPQGEPKNVLQVGLPTNFKAARFGVDAATEMLRELESDIESARLDVDGESLELPVKLKVHDSLFVPLAKWPMLMTGNYRCIRPGDMIPIEQAVHADLRRSREIYEWVSGLCVGLGADRADLVPFEKYAQAAASLKKPSSAARALYGGALNIERVDALVQKLAKQQGLSHDAINETVGLVDARLAGNRVAQEPKAA
jgi:hypothetical protein